MENEKIDNEKLFNVTVRVPTNIEIPMIHATGFSDYELWVFIASILSNLSVAFLIFYIQNTETNKHNLLLGVTITFGLLFGVSCYQAFNRRYKLTSNTTLIKV
jgi:ABC-type Mn2+/Zn2+ transport system permease subunit